MNKFKYTLLAVAAAAAVSCAKEVSPEVTPDVNNTTNQNLVEITLKATTEGEEETKAVFSGYPKIAWELHDEISLLGTNTVNQKFTADTKGHQTTFTGLADLSDDVYYAVYPYNANVTLNDDGTLAGVTVPAVQTATAGSFDPKAYIAVAKSTDKENLHFLAVGGFVKFKLEDAENVKSVTLVSNTGKNMACTASKTSITETSVGHSGEYSNVSDRVKLEGTFENDKAYFMVVRPQPYEGGITIMIEYKDGTVLSRTGTKSLFEGGKGRNYIRNFNILQKKDFVKDLYAEYSNGKEITIGDKTISSSVNKKAMKVIANDPEKPVDLYNYISNEGVYFLTSTNGGYFSIATNTNIASNVYIIGDNNTTIKFDAGKAINFKSGTLAFKDVIIDASNITSNQLISNYGATKDTDNLIFDGCKILNLKYPLYAINGGGNGAYKPYTCKNITLVNSDVQIGGNLGNGIINLANTTSEAAIDVNFSNNIFYASTNTTARIINNNGNLSSYSSSLRFVNNTVFNLHSGVSAGLLHMAGASTVEFKNNLFDFWSINDVADGTKYEYAVRIWKNTPTYDVENNHYWRRDGNTVESDNFISHGDGAGAVAATTATAAITSGAYPFTSTVPGAGATR